MNSPSLLRIRVAFYPAMLLALACVKCPAQTTESIQSDTIDITPTQNPWQKLDDMPRKLGRFALATDQKYIYRLGGIGFNIRRGGRYGHGLSAFDPATQRWQKLPSTPQGTGGAHLAWWPAQESLVMISGIKRLGDQFSSRSLTIGTYSIGQKKWDKQIVPSPGLGRVSAMIHLDQGRFLLVAGDDNLNSDRTAILNLDTEPKSDSPPAQVKMVGKFPKAGRIIGIAKLADTVVVLQAGTSTSHLQKFSATSGEHLDSVDLSTNFIWTDKLLAWQGNLLIWKNHDPSRPNSYQHASEMVSVNPVSGRCQVLHPEFPGPTSRRSSEGIVVADAFYLFGGQRDDQTWLKDAHRYQFSAK